MMQHLQTGGGHVPVAGHCWDSASGWDDGVGLRAKGQTQVYLTIWAQVLALSHHPAVASAGGDRFPTQFEHAQHTIFPASVQHIAKTNTILQNNSTVSKVQFIPKK